MILLEVADMSKLAARSRPKTIAGNSDEMYRLTAAGKGVIGSENLASLRGLKIGDPIELPTPNGVLRLPLVGFVQDYVDQHGEVFMDRAVYVKYWNDDTVDHFRVFLKRGADPAAVREAILRKFSGDRHIFVLSTREVRQFIGGLADQWFAITW